MVGYSEYLVTWDDAYLLHRALCFHNAVYTFDLKAMFSCYAILSKSPIMTVVTLPWGAAASGEGAISLCLVSLALLTWIVALLSYRAALSSGASPWMMAAAALSVWWNPFLASYGGTFLSDMLLAWTVLLTLLLIPLELATDPQGWVRDVMRGVLWGFVFDVGALTKVTYGYFLVPVVAVVMQHSPQALRDALVVGNGSGNSDLSHAVHSHLVAVRPQLSPACGRRFVRRNDGVLFWRGSGLDRVPQAICCRLCLWICPDGSPGRVLYPKGVAV